MVYLSNDDCKYVIEHVIEHVLTANLLEFKYEKDQIYKDIAVVEMAQHMLHDFVMEQFIQKYSGYVYWNVLFSDHKFSLEFILNHIPDNVYAVNWEKFIIKQRLPDLFWIEYKQVISVDCDWYRLIFTHQKLSEKTIRYCLLTDGSCYGYFSEICWKQTISEQFIIDFYNDVEWNGIGSEQKLSSDFIKKHGDKLAIGDLISNKKINYYAGYSGVNIDIERIINSYI